MNFVSKNPYNGMLLENHEGHQDQDILQILKKSASAFKSWRQTPLDQRSQLLNKVAYQLQSNQEVLATTISQEMGKPIKEARSEIAKCAWLCNYYRDHAGSFLEPVNIPTGTQESYVRFDPLGSILGIMPWNFPFWQVFRFAIPCLTAGNVCLLKHAPNVLRCAKFIEDIFYDAGYPPDVFQNLFIHEKQVAGVIAHEAVKAVALTGSERAGSSVAALAGKHLKKTVLELGGNNAFVVLPDANLNQAVQKGITARMLNAGQSCIAAKRFIITEPLYEDFVRQYSDAVEKLILGDPMDDETDIGPLARKDLADNLHRQVRESIHSGANLICGGKQDDCLYAPTVLGNVKENSPAFEEETFGPLAAMVRAKDEKSAITLAKKTRYGLGVTLFTTDIKRAKELAAEFDDGAVFVNELVKSDPRLPFGGTKLSGYGRELGKEGIMEFVNCKTVYISDQ